MNGKPALRTAILSRRRARTPDDVAGRSARLTAHLLDHPLWRAATAVAGFVGVRGEVDTRALLAAALQAGKALWLPRMVGPRGAQRVGFVRVADLDVLAPAGFGLIEPGPAAGPEVALVDAGVDLVLVPGVAFSRAGARLGHGKGHYDRALAPLAAPGPALVGVCFAEELDPAEGPVPEEPHDVRVGWVATEDGVITCA